MLHNLRGSIYISSHYKSYYIMDLLFWSVTDNYSPICDVSTSGCWYIFSVDEHYGVGFFHSDRNYLYQ